METKKFKIKVVSPIESECGEYIPNALIYNNMIGEVETAWTDNYKFKSDTCKIELIEIDN